MTRNSVRITGRTAFTANDDSELRAWVKSCKEKNRRIYGNEIFQEFERLHNGRHPWQSWRNRWINHLDKAPVPLTDSFALDQFELLLDVAGNVMRTPPERVGEAWESFIEQMGDWGKEMPSHSAKDWAKFFNIVVKPIHTDLVKSETRTNVYHEAWNEWYEQHGRTAAIRDWLQYYETTVRPKCLELDQKGQAGHPPPKRPKFNAQTPEERPMNSSPLENPAQPTVSAHQRSPQPLVSNPPSLMRQNLLPDLSVPPRCQDEERGRKFKRVQDAVDKLDEKQMFSLLETLRVLPYAPEEQANMALRDALAMHIVDVLDRTPDEESQTLGGDYDAENEDDTEEEERPGAQDNVQPVVSREHDEAVEEPMCLHRVAHRERTISDNATSTLSEFPTNPACDLRTAEESEAYIASRLEPPHNFREEDVVSALHATCADSTAMADAVLRCMRNTAPTAPQRGNRSIVGAAILPDAPGVWTADDDGALRTGLDPARSRVVRKHGKERCAKRLAFLAALID